jgi:hypothetical protein
MHQTPSHVECSLNGLDLGGIGLAGADRLTGLTAPHELPVAGACVFDKPWLVPVRPNAGGGFRLAKPSAALACIPIG